MKSSVIYRRKDGWYIHSESKTSTGAGIASPPYIKQPATVGAFELGSEVFHALQDSGQAVPPYPKDWNAVFAPMLELAGVQTWGQFMKGAPSLGVQLDDGGIEIISMRNDGRGNYVAVDAAPIVIAADASPLQLGEAILRALELCE